MSSLNLHHEGVTVEFSDETFLYNVVITYRDREKTENVNTAPLPYEDAKRIHDSFYRNMKDGRGSFNLVSGVSLEHLNIPVQATVDDRTAAWWQWGWCQHPMRKYDCWFLTFYRLRVLDSEVIEDDVEEQPVVTEAELLFTLARLQRNFERGRAARENADEWANVIVSALTCEDTPTEVYHHLRSEINGAFAGA